MTDLNKPKDSSNDAKLDQLLDNALADYSNVEPRAGFEDRILANLDRSADSAQAETRSWLRWWPALSFAGAAVTALLIFLALPRTNTQPPQVALNTPAKVAPAPTPAFSATNPPRVAINSHPRAHVPVRSTPAATNTPQLAVVKQDVFPAPSPLTDQEELLFSYMRRTPVAEIAANAKPDALPAIVRQTNEQQINQTFPGPRDSDSNTNTR